MCDAGQRRERESISQEEEEEEERICVFFACSKIWIRNEREILHKIRTQ